MTPHLAPLLTVFAVFALLATAGVLIAVEVLS